MEFSEFPSRIKKVFSTGKKHLTFCRAHAIVSTILKSVDEDGMIL